MTDNCGERQKEMRQQTENSEKSQCEVLTELCTVYSILFVILEMNRLCSSSAAVLVFTAIDNVKNVVD